MKKIILIGIIFAGISLFSQQDKFTTYRVSAKETISSIARKLGVTPYDLLKLNPDANDGVNIDEVLIIPNNKFSKNKNKPLEVSQQTTLNVVKLKDSIVDGYIYHTVKPLETIYSLSNKYEVSKRKTRKLNKLNRKGDISVGQILKFPKTLKNTYKIKEKNTISTDIYSDKKNNESFFVYIVKPKDTYYTLSRVYNVTEAQLKQINPILNEGLKSGLEIKIPKPTDNLATTRIEELKEKDFNEIKDGVNFKDNFPIDSINKVALPEYFLHIVKEKEGFFRLEQLYGFAEEEIITINPELKDGLKLGMTIKIPVKKEENLMLEGDIQGEVLNIVLMLPFNASLGIDLTDKSSKAKRLNNIIDFYLGSLMALDSIKKKGVSVNVKVFDTKDSPFVVNNILSTYNFEETDLVIAPIKFNQYSTVVNNLEKFNIPVISPVSSKDSSLLGTTNSVQNIPVANLVQEKTLSYLMDNISNQNIIIIANELKLDESADFNIELIKSKLIKHDSINKVSIIRMKDGYIKRELFEDNTSSKKENWVILASSHNNTTSIAVDNLAVFPNNYNITLFSLMKPNNINKLNSKYLNKLNFQYPEVNFNDKENSQIKIFNNKYKSKYKALPSDLSYKGFDSTYDALIRLANFKNINDAYNSGKSYRLISKFDYKQNISKSFSNTGIFLVKYNNYSLELVN